MAKIIFITGTDTGVGKTVVTGLLLRHLREAGIDARAVKPFCSGSRADAVLLRMLQENVLTLDEINPFFFKKPMAPAAAAQGRKTIRLDNVLAEIRAVASGCEVLLVEGIGGLLVPLGKNYTVADLIRRLGCRALVVSRNRLGTINHTLLTADVMQATGIKQFKIVMVEDKRPDISAVSNRKIIREMLPLRRVISIRNFGFGASRAGIIKRNAKKLKITLARILDDDSFSLVLPKKRRERLINKVR